MPRKRYQPRSQRADNWREADKRARAKKAEELQSWQPLRSALSGKAGEYETDALDAKARRRVREARDFGASAQLVQYALELLRVDRREGSIKAADTQSALRGLAKLAAQIDSSAPSTGVELVMNFNVDADAVDALAERTGVNVLESDEISIA